MAADNQKSAFSRVFVMDGGARPNNPAAYYGLTKAGAFQWAMGDNTLIRKPDPGQYGKFVTIGNVQGEQGDPMLTLTTRYTTTLSKFFALAKKRCNFDVQVHMGECQNPQDFNRGWDKILMIEDTLVTNYNTTDLGALEPGENAVVNEDVPLAGQDAIELTCITYSEKATIQVAREVLDVIVCDSTTCGNCGIPSDGCQIIFAITKSSAASPGLPPEVIYSQDGGVTWLDFVISTIGAAQDPSGAACVGANLVVVCQATTSLHYIPIADLLGAVGVWTQVTTGFVATKGPNAIFSVNANLTWIVGQGGYIYSTTDPTSGVNVVDAGVATTQNLLAVHAYDELNAVAVGANNAVVFTTDGQNWQAVTGPLGGVSLNTVFMKTTLQWWVGTSSGRLFYTLNAGITWFEKAFPGSSAGSVRYITFYNNMLGYMAHDTATPVGRIFRTIDGGASWYTTPEKSASYRLPDNDRINKVAICANPNVVFAGGLGGAGTDGILLKGTGS